MALIVAEPTSTICIGNLPDYVSPREFRMLFKFAAGVERCIVNMTKRGRQVGYARFATEEEAKAAVEWLNGFPLDEEFPQPMKVFMSSTQLNDRTPGIKRPLDFGWGGAPQAKFPAPGGKGWGAGLDYGTDFGVGGGMFPPAFGGKGNFGGFGMGRGGMGMGAPFGFGKGFGKGKGAVNPSSVYVGGVPHDWDEATLTSLFEGFGTVNRVHLMRGTNPLGNIAFVHFAEAGQASAAIQNMNSYPLDGNRHLVVRH